MDRTDETTNTNIKISTKIMEDFKLTIKKQGYRLRKGIEKAISEYTERHKRDS